MKNVGWLGSLLITISLLSGCANMMKSFGYARIPPATVNACSKSPILITNLKADPYHRHYLLPDGRACCEVNTHE